MLPRFLSSAWVSLLVIVTWEKRVNTWLKELPNLLIKEDTVSITKIIYFVSFFSAVVYPLLLNAENIDGPMKSKLRFVSPNGG